MFRSARPGLLALLRGLRFVGNALKSFLLRCLLFWPHFLRSLRRIWPLYSRTSPNDIPKKKELGSQAKPSFPGASGCEGYSIIYASRDPNRSSELHLPLGSGSTEVLHLGPIVGQSQAPHSPTSELQIEPPSPSSPQFPGDSTPFRANAGDMQFPHVPHLNAPLTLTHSRITSMQFAGAPRRPRSPSPFSRSHLTILESAAVSPRSGYSRSLSPPPSRPPSPLPFSLPHPLHSVRDSSGSIQIPDVAISPPPVLETAEVDSISSFPVFVQEEHSVQFPITSVEHWTLEPSDAGNLGLVNARHSNEILRPDSLVLSTNRARSVTLPYGSQVTLEHIPFPDESMNWSDGKKRSIGLMHSEQVSRYVNKGDV
jgi:hypothetical protein